MMDLSVEPSVWRDGGYGVTVRWGVAETDLGDILVAATAKGVCRLSFAESGDVLGRYFPRAERIEGGDFFPDLLAAVVEAVNHPRQVCAIPLDVQGTAFQEAVWEALKAIPLGETRTYTQIAQAAGNAKAVRAAGSANGANHVAVLIPCHRVIRSDGGLGGYAYGEGIKQALLSKEVKQA